MKFDGLLGALKSGNVDIVVAGMTPTEERKQAVNFTDVYHNGAYTIPGITPVNSVLTTVVTYVVLTKVTVKKEVKVEVAA